MARYLHYRQRTRRLEEIASMLSMPTADALSRYLDLATQQMKLTAANMANQNTDGYTRRSTTFSSGDSVVIGSRSTSSGVSAKVTAQRDTVLQKAVWQATEDAAGSSARLTAVNSLQSLFAINGDGQDSAGVGAALSGFFNAATTLATSPNDATMLQSVLTAGANVAATFNRTVAQLALQKNSVAQQMDAVVVQANDLLGTVASLNGQVASAGVGADTSAVVDQRNIALTSLAGMLDVTTTAAKDGSLSVSLSDGTPLVTAAHAVVLNSSNGMVRLGTQPLNGVIHGGSLGGSIAFLTRDLAPVSAQLDAMAEAFVTSVNAFNQASIASSGSYGSALFTGTTAATMQMTATSTSQIGVGTDGSGASQTGALASAPMVGGQTLSENLSSLMIALGQSAASTKTQSTTDAAVLTQTSTQLAAVSGVSLDTEAANLTQYQRSYEAAAKVLAIVNQLMAQAINLGNGTTVS